MEKAYQPQKIEKKIYAFWEKGEFFNPDKLPGKRKKTFAITMAPPNITGHIHVGHALENTLLDILIRQKRMQGYQALFLPGKDHAGIAAQYVVEKQLKKEGLTRFDLGKEKFLKRMWQWMEEYGSNIDRELKKLGLSCDWSRLRFTMDKNYQQAVKKAFEHYQSKDWIYRGKRMVNWCSRCATNISDLEVQYQERKSKLWYLKYPILKNPKSKIQKYIVVATTRPETMLGDAAVAVSPKDKRYKNVVGKTAILPIQNREIPIIADKLVDPKFGTGAVKVTPGHDNLDFEIGQKHKLPFYYIIDEKSRMTEQATVCQGLSVEECRAEVLKILKSKGLVEKEEDYIHNVGVCERCKTIIEPLISEQWFLSMKELANLALKAIQENKIKFIPPQRKRIFINWFRNIKDWNISRQLWWGHRLPIWYCGGSKNVPEHKMGFHKDVVPQVLKGKTKTYRLRDHGFQIGDKVLFENSQTKTFFGYGIITGIEEMKIEEINYKDKAHYKTYRNLKELIAAFKIRNPDKKVTAKSKTYLYEYEFHLFTKDDAKRGCGQIIVAIRKPKRCPACKGMNLPQDNDVLDTWFSSALWPFATLGWPQKTKWLKEFYPTTVISSAREIFFLWIARMVFSGLEFMKRVPFTIDYTHPTVLDEKGRKMSKSLGNVVDPMELIEKYGVDATRFGLIWQTTGVQDIHWSEDGLLAGRKFCNKIWNAARFVLEQKGKSQASSSRQLTVADKKILKALEKTEKAVNNNLANFHFGHALQTIYKFFWHDFCDHYIEKAKKQKDKENTQKILLFVLLNSLKILHPFLPHITEEIYQRLPLKQKTALIIESWPK